MIKQPTIPPMPKRPTFDARDTQYNLPIGTDLISRQAAIDAILHITNCKSVRELFEYNQEHHLTEMWSGGVNDAIDAVIGVESATDTNVGTKLSTNLAEVGTDLISRQALLDKFEPWLKVKDYNDGELNMLKAILYEIRFMRPAQHEIIRMNTGFVRKQGCVLTNRRTVSAIGERGER